MVHNLQQAFALRMHRLQYLEIVHGKVVKPHIVVLFNTLYGRDMPYMGMFGIVQIEQNGSRR